MSGDLFFSFPGGVEIVHGKKTFIGQTTFGRRLDIILPLGGECFRLGLDINRYLSIFYSATNIAIFSQVGGSGFNFSGNLSIGTDVLPTSTSRLTIGACTAALSSLNIPNGTAPSSPVDGDIWRQDNTNTGLKIRVNGVTKTITLV